MSQSTNLGQLSPSAWDELQELADRFEAACRNGVAADLAAQLPAADHPLRCFALRELIAIELAACWQRGERRRLDHYVARFPELEGHSALVLDLLYEELQLRLRHGDRPELAEYAQRHPLHHADLQKLLAERPLPGLGVLAAAGTERGSTFVYEDSVAPSALSTTAEFRPGTAASGIPSAGERVADFELLRLLGEGSFGKVFLARQISLDRQVALKIASDSSNEARTLASLEHDHIVQVFSETLDRRRNLRFLCMQFVAGPTLERIITELRKLPRERWSGQAILEAIDRLSQHPALFHPLALRDRELLSGSDFVQAVCWLGARLAEALDYAHGQGVLHRDIKPANILLSQYGRPLLADFNVSLQTQGVGAHLGPLGGTLAYMAPEHLDACHPDGDTLPEAVAERADLFSLGVTLFELLTGQRPFADQIAGAPNRVEAIQLMREARLQGPPAAGELYPQVPAVFDGVLKRCLAPDPAARYASASELARALEGCRELRRIEHELPHGDRFTLLAQTRPFLAMLLLALLPQVIGSVVNIVYNLSQIVDSFQTPALRQAFDRVALVYNLVVYPLCVWLLYRRIMSGYRVWRQFQSERAAEVNSPVEIPLALETASTLALPRGQPTSRLGMPAVPRSNVRSAPHVAHSGILPERARVAFARRQMLAWPAWAVILSCVGWLPGGLIFPLAIDLLAGRLGVHEYAHFLISFTLSGLIALTYSYFGMQFIVLRGLYPRFWTDPQNVHAEMQVELRQHGPWLGLYQLLAGVIPLGGAILLVVVGPSASGDLTFRLLAVLLIVLGMAGFGLAIAANKYLTRVLNTLAGERGG